MATVDYDFRGETGARLNTDNAGNNPCFFRDDQDATLPVQFASVTIANTSANGVILAAPTGASAPAVTEQTGASPGSGNQHFINEILWDDANEAEILLSYVVEIPAQMVANGINVREFTLVLAQQPLVGGNDNAYVGVHVNCQAVNPNIHDVRLMRTFNEANFLADATTADTITDGTEFTTGDFLLFRCYKRLPNGVGGGQVVSNFKVYNMGSVLGTIDDMVDFSAGTLIATAQGSGEFSFGGTDLDLACNYGFIGCSSSGTAVGPRLVYLRAEQYSVPSLTMATGFPAGSTGDRIQFDAGAEENIYMPLQLGRSGNMGLVDLSISTAPTTSGLTISILTDIDGNNIGLIGGTAASNAGLGNGSFVVRATFADAATANLTVNYSVVAAPRSGGLPLYVSGKPANDGLAGSSTIDLSASAIRAAKDTRCQGGNNWATPAYNSEAALEFGASTTSIGTDWAKDESNGAASPGITARMMAAMLLAANATRKLLTIPPVSNPLVSGDINVVKADTMDWLQYIVNHQIDIYTQEVGIRLASPTATGTSATGSTVNVLRASGGTLSTTPGTYDGRWVTIEIATDEYEVAEITSHTQDGATLVLTLALQSGQAQALSTAHANGLEVNIHANTIPNKIKQFNAMMPGFADSGHADYISAANGATVYHAMGNFVSSLWTLSNADGLWTHQTGTGAANLAALIVAQWTEAILGRASVALTPTTTSASVDFSRTISGADNYGEDVFPTNMIPEANTWTTTTGSINANTGNFTYADASGTVRNTLTYSDNIYGEASVTVESSGGGRRRGSIMAGLLMRGRARL